MNRLFVARAEAGLTQDQLASLSGVSRVTIARLEQGAAPSAIVAGRLAKALEASVVDLFSDEREAA